jgi:hypothetical protein
MAENDCADSIVTGEPAAAKLNCTSMLDIVEAGLHSRKREWVFLRELRIGTGHRHHEMQRLDAFALNCLPHLGMKRVCYEVKCSRADFLGELRRPLKRRIGMRFSNEFYFVTPAGMLSLDELPSDCGLVEVGRAVTEESQRLVRQHLGTFYIDPATGDYCMLCVPAPWRDTPGPTWQFLAAMLRNQQRLMEEKPLPPPKQQRLTLE